MPRSFLVKNKVRASDHYANHNADNGLKEQPAVLNNNAKKHQLNTKENLTAQCRQSCCTSERFVSSPRGEYCHSNTDYWSARFPFYSKPKLYSPDNHLVKPDISCEPLPEHSKYTRYIYHDLREQHIVEGTKYYEISAPQLRGQKDIREQISMVSPMEYRTSVGSERKSSPRLDVSEPDISPQPIKKKDKQTRHFSCKYCDKDYMTLGALKMHIRTHTLPCKCKICGKAFSRPWLLQGHIRTHTGERPFGCSYCGRAFADRSNLRAHIQTHVDVKKYECKQCSKTFSRSTLLKKHELSDCLPLKVT